MSKWVVWSHETDGWWPSERLSQHDATDLAEAFSDQGVDVVIRPAHSVTMADVIEG